MSAVILLLGNHNRMGKEPFQGDSNDFTCTDDLQIVPNTLSWGLRVNVRSVTCVCPVSCRPLDEDHLRPITQLDLLFGLDKMRESKQATATMGSGIAEVPLD